MMPRHLVGDCMHTGLLRALSPTEEASTKVLV